MHWLYLILAGLFEIGFTTTLKLTEGFTKLVPSVIFTICAFLSFSFLTKAVERIELGTAYAVWTGVGVVGTILIGIFYYKENASALKLFFLFTLVSSIIGLKFSTSHN